MGHAARLSCTSTGHAWLMTMTDEQAVALVIKQGFGQPNEFGPNAPTTIKALLRFPARCAVRGYAMIDEVFAPRMSAVAVPVVSGSRCVGVISLGGAAGAADRRKDSTSTRCRCASCERTCAVEQHGRVSWSAAAWEGVIDSSKNHPISRGRRAPFR